MASTSSRDTQLEVLQKKVRILQVRSLISVIAIVLLAALLAVAELAPDTGNEVVDTLIAHQIIVKDTNGNDRIIIAPHIGPYGTRLRSDTLSGVLVLDAAGNDRVILGASPTVQSAGRIVRRAEDDVPYGVAFNDDSGNERGGFGYYSRRRFVSFGMDTESSEGLTMFVADDSFYGQKAGILINREGAGQVIYLGHNTAGLAMLNLDAPGKGRLAMMIDSTASGSIEYFDYLTGGQSTLARSK